MIWCRNWRQPHLTGEEIETQRDLLGCPGLGTQLAGREEAGTWRQLGVRHMIYCLSILLWSEFTETQICICLHRTNQVAELQMRQVEWQAGK